MLAFGVVFGASAQVAQQHAQLAKMKRNVTPVVLEQPVATPSAAAAGDTISGLYYDFSTPANWVFGNSSTPTADWVISTTVATGSFSSSYGIVESETAANGFAMFDSDGLGSGSSAHNSWIQLANSVDLTGFSSVAVAFQQYNVRYQNNNYLEVSTDGTTWTTYEVTPAAPLNDAGDNPEYVTINISGAVSVNPATVWIRFRFEGTWDYVWYVDDVAFVEGASNDLVMNDVWHGDIINAFEYQQIPLDQVTEVVIGATCENKGGANQTNAVYTWDISDASGSLATGTFAANSTTLAPTSSDTTWYATGFTPSATGDYTVTVSVAGDQADEAPGDNEAVSMFKVTDNIFAHDDEDNIEFIVTGTDASGGVAEFKMALYYEIQAAANLTAVQVAFGRLTTTTSCIIEVFDAVNDQALSNPIATEVYDILPGDVSTGNGVTIFTDILINDGDGVMLDAGGLYLISIGNTGTGEELYLEASGGDDDRARLGYGPFGAGGAIDWYTGYTSSPIIRANFDETIGIEENEDVSGVSIYPNPTTDNLNINFVSKENQNITINVIGVDGALVFSDNLTTKVGQSTKTTVDFANLAKGIYMVQLVGSNSSLTQRVVVQ